MFLTSRNELEQQLCNYSLDVKEENSTVNLEHFRQYLKKTEEYTGEKTVPMLNEEMHIKCEADADDKQ